MTIGVVIVTHNSESVLAAALDSLPAALNGSSALVVVVDNGSTDGTVRIAAQRGDCLVLEGPNQGYSAGINRGVRAAASCSEVLVLNPDVRCCPRAVANMLEVCRARKAIVAPRLVDEEGKTMFSLRRRPTVLRAAGLGFLRLPWLSDTLTDEGDYEQPKRVAWATGAALMVPKECHDALDGWDETFFLYSEETDFCLRAEALGWKTLYEPSAVIQHTGRGSGWNDKLYCMQIVNRVRLYTRFHGSRRGWVYFAAALLREAVRSAGGDRQSAAAVRALLVPSARPAELSCSDRVLPR